MLIENYATFISWELYFFAPSYVTINRVEVRTDVKLGVARQAEQFRWAFVHEVRDRRPVANLLKEVF